MDKERFKKVRQTLIDKIFKTAEAKGEDYTKGSVDVLANFKEVGKKLKLNPKQILLVYMDKHQEAIANYIQTNGRSESEPIEERIIDNINYLLLLWGLIVEENENIVCKGERKKITTMDSWRAIETLPVFNRERFTFYSDGTVRERCDDVGGSNESDSVRHRSEESGTLEYLGSFGTGGNQLSFFTNPAFSVQKKPQ